MIIKKQLCTFCLMNGMAVWPERLCQLLSESAIFSGLSCSAFYYIIFFR